MNPLTLVKRIQSINSKEATLGISEEASWHAKYKDSAYVFVGGIPFDLTEGDLLAVFAQYGEVVDVNLVRDKGTGKSKGFAFLAYEDQRSTILAVDNLNGAQVSGRTIRVDHVSNYKKKEEEDEEAEQQKREARGVCRAFQKGECTRGAGCKFSHDEQRAANTGWGAEDNKKWGHDRFEAPKKIEKRPGNIPPLREPEPSFRARTNERASGDYHKNGDKTVQKRSGKFNDDEFELKPREDRHRAEEKRGRRCDDDELELKPREDRHRAEEKRGRRYEDDGLELKPREDHDRRERKRSGRYNDYEFEPKRREDRHLAEEKRGRRYDDDELEMKPREDREQKKSMRHDDRRSPEIQIRREEKRSGRHDDSSFESKPREDRDGRERKRSSESYAREDRDNRGGDKKVANDRDSSSRRHRER